MENQKGSVLLGRNIFAEAFEQFDEEEFFNNLHSQVRNKSYFEKYKGFKTTLLWLSYLFSLISASTACYAVYWLMERVSGTAVYGISLVGVAIAVLFLFFFEKLKRKSSSEFWQVFFFNRKLAGGWLILSLCLLTISLLSSAFGTKQGVENLAPDPELLATDSLGMEYRARVAALEKENAELARQKNHEGVIYYHVQSSIKKNKGMIADYSARILELDKKLEGKNEILSAEYAAEIKFTVWTLVWVNIAMDLLFEACIAYIWYYYYRSYVERRATKGIATDTPDARQVPSPAPTSPASQQNFDASTLLQQINAQLSLLQKMQTSEYRSGATESDPPAPTLANRFNRTVIAGFMPPANDINPLQRVATSSNVTSPPSGSITTYDDFFTILHHRFSDGKPVRYGSDRVDWYVKHYEQKLSEAKQEGQNAAIENFQAKLAYWHSRQRELYAKLAKAPAETK